MLENDIVQPSQSPWAAPIVLVKKKSDSTRFFVDYRKLNAVTLRDAYPLPRIDDALSVLSGSYWFSTLDTHVWSVDTGKSPWTLQIRRQQRAYLNLK